MKVRYLIALMLSIGAAAPTMAAPCLHYMGNPVSLSGKVTLRTFFGPPNYGENPKTDSREKQAILLLPHPICVDANQEERDVAEANQMEVTLVPLKEERFGEYVGKRVTVVGRLFHANTAHHHTAVLMQVDKIEINISEP